MSPSNTGTSWPIRDIATRPPPNTTPRHKTQTQMGEHRAPRVHIIVHLTWELEREKKSVGRAVEGGGGLGFKKILMVHWKFESIPS